MSRISRPAVRGKTKKSFFSRSSVSFASLVILLLWILYVQFFAEIYHEERPFFNTLEGMKNISGSSLPSSNQRVHQCKLHGETIKLPMAPDLIVAGAQKAGTSAFYLMLRKHPNLVSSSTFEAHFFDWEFAVPPKDLDKPETWEKFNATTEDEMFCSARQQYIKKNFPTERLLASGRQLVTFEKTPNYASLPQVPELISKICPWAKVILMLRNPVDRAYSNYQMDKKLNKVSETFEELVRKEIQVMKKVKLTKVSADKIENWDIQDTTMDQLFNNPPSNMTQEELDHAHWSVYRQRHLRNYLQRGIYSDLLERWLKYFELGSTLMVINNERLHAEPRQVMKEVLRFLDSPKTDFFDDEKVSLVSTTPPGRKSMLLSVGGYNPMANNTRHFLEKFYNPYNQQIAGILGEEWKGVWRTSGRMNAG